ncbi:MAG: alpha/beta hydrolase family protein [Bacteroidota bacterium]|nr:alpha/beta hydrolase family protein [Bacteroidota bacterium]MDP4227485.1 alpha/beta hydrolase family protein [Bacteroidota bacterium]
MCRNLFCLIVVLLVVQSAFLLKAATVDTTLTYSASMKKNIKAIVVKPDSYQKGTRYPVLYLLHGYGGDYADWITKVPAIKAYADQYQFMIVCPDGNFSSWYLDSPIDPKSKYETYVGTELVNWIDKHYNTIASSSGRAITGLSMGGYGALYLAFRHQNVFGAAGSMSGGVDLRPFPGNWDLPKRIGMYAQYPENWDHYSVVNLTYLLTPGSLALIIDCGSEDFFFKVNEKLHQKLLINNIPHDFISRPGGHSWEYWANSIQYQMLFMNKYFNKARNSSNN